MMQPYFFPYLGYFDLINRADRWVFFDTAQYIRHGWVNRNRILHPKSGGQYIVVPLVRHDFDTPIARVETTDPAEWRPRILGQLRHYKKHAPYFQATMQLVEDCLAGDDRSLSRRNILVAERVCAHLDIRRTFAVFSMMDIKLGPIDGPADWALRVCQAIGADEYVNPPGGAGLYDLERYQCAGVRLTIQEPFEFAYGCPGYGFAPSLSVIDALMWNPPEAIKNRLDQRLRGAEKPAQSDSVATGEKA